MTPRPLPARPPLALVAAAFAAIYLIWGSTYLGIRFALETMPPFWIAGLRFSIAGALMVAVARRRGAPAPTRTQWQSALILGFFLFLCANGGIMLAEQVVPSGLTALLVATVPLWVTVQNWLLFRGGRPVRRVLIGLAAGFVGIILLVGPDRLGGAVDPLGAALLIGSSSCWAFGSLLTRRLAVPTSPLLTAGMNLLLGGLLMTATSLILGEWAALDWGAISLKSWLSMLYLLVFGSIIGFGAYTYLLSVMPAPRVATYAYINPIVAVILGALLAGEALTERVLLAGVIIIGAVALITSARQQAPKLVETPDKPETLPAPAGGRPLPARLNR